MHHVKCNIITAQYLSIAMLSNLVAVLWSVYVVRAWTRPGQVSNTLSRICQAIAPSLGLTKKTVLCKCLPTFLDDNTGQYASHNGDTINGQMICKECESGEGPNSEETSFNGQIEKLGFQACKWHLVLDIADRIVLVAFCLVMVGAILILFIILPYVHGKIFV